MYPVTLGTDLSPQGQRTLESLQAQLVVVQGKIAALAAIIAAADTKPAKKREAQGFLAIRQKQLTSLQTKIARLTNTPAPPPTTETPPATTPPANIPGMTPVWTTPESPEPVSPYTADGGGVTAPATPTTETGTLSVPTSYLVLGVLVLYLFSGRRASA